MTEIEKASKVEAHRRAELIRLGMVTYAQTLETIAEAFAARDWVTLGYGSWDDYTRAEFSEKRLKLSAEARQQAVEALRLTGMSPRAIASALGVGEGTVRRDLAGAPNGAPETSVGADGKTYSASNPAKGAREARTPADDRHSMPVTTGQPADRPAEAADPAPAAADGADLYPAPSAPSPLETYIAGEPKLARTGWQKNFAAALTRSIGIVSFTPEQVAEYADRELVGELRRLVTNLDDYATRAEKAWNQRHGGLRVLPGGAA